MSELIDVHAHVVIESLHGQAEGYGPEAGFSPDGVPWFRVGKNMLRGVDYAGTAFVDVDRRLAAMDEAGIRLQALSPNPLTYFHSIDSTSAVRFCRAHNEALAELVASHPGRLCGLAALPMQNLAAAVDELEYAIRDLGLLGGYIGTDLGMSLSSPLLDPFYSTVVALDVPLFVHPAPPGWDGGPDEPRMREFELDVIVGFAQSETLAVAELIYGGVLDRFPTIDICVSHGGGAVPFLYGRMKNAAARRSWSPFRADPEGFDDALRRLWFDSHVQDRRALTMLVEAVGTDHLVFGTNFAGWDHDPHPEILGMDSILTANARRLLRLDKLRER